MKHLLPCVVLVMFVALLAGIANAEGDAPPAGDAATDADNPPVVTALATTFEQFQAKVPIQAKDPKGAVHLWLEAIYIYTTKDKELGEKCITVMCKDKDWKTTMNYFTSALTEKTYRWRSYAKGATPENNYQMDPNKFDITLTRINLQPNPDKPEGQIVKFFIACGGADLPRPMTIERNNKGIYKASEFSSLCVGVKKPQEVLDKEQDF